MNAHQKPSSEITTFNFEGDDLRVIEEGGELIFIAADAATSLAYRDAANLAQSLDQDEKGTCIVSTPSGDQPMIFITEAGLYRAIIQRRVSKKLTSERRQKIARFQRWVFHDVLPSIRRTGAYIHEGVTVSNLDKATRKAIGGMIKSNAGVVIREALAPLQAELHQTQQELASLKRRIESPQTCTAADIWRHYNYGPLRGGTVWLGNRLMEMGCTPEYGASERHGNQSRRKFDIAKSHIAMKNGLKLHTDRYIAERQGQGKLDLKGK